LVVDIHALPPDNEPVDPTDDHGLHWTSHQQINRPPLVATHGNLFKGGKHIGWEEPNQNDDGCYAGCPPCAADKKPACNGKLKHTSYIDKKDSLGNPFRQHPGELRRLNEVSDAGEHKQRCSSPRRSTSQINRPAFWGQKTHQQVWTSKQDEHDY